MRQEVRQRTAASLDFSSSAWHEWRFESLHFLLLLLLILLLRLATAQKAETAWPCVWNLSTYSQRSILLPLHRCVSDGRNTGCPTILLFFLIFEMFIVGQPVVSLLTLYPSLSLSLFHSFIQKKDSHVFAACRCGWWWCAACCGAACIVWRQLRLDANRNAMGRKSLPSAAVGTFLGNCSIPSYIISLSLSLLALSQRSHTFTLPVYRLLLQPSMWQHFYSSYVHPRPRPLSSAFISYSYPPSVLPQELNLSTTPNTYVETPF